MKPGKSGLARLFDAAAYSASGIRACWRNEAAFRQEVVLLLVLLPFSFLVARSVEQWLLLVTPLLQSQQVAAFAEKQAAAQAQAEHNQELAQQPEKLGLPA